MISEVEQATQRINDIINEQGIMVEQQGQNLDEITEQLMNANKNMTQTNEQLDEAAQLQKKSKRKYFCLVAIIIIVIIAAAGVIFILTS